MMIRSTLVSVRLFCSYSHKDEKLRDRLGVHLSLLKRRGKIQEWYDRKISGGERWENVLHENLEASHIILLLVSADFLDSDYCYNREMRRALEKHEAGEARVIPVILRPVDWSEAPFAHLQVFPKDARPVTKWSNRDEAWVDVSIGIRKVIEALHERVDSTQVAPEPTIEGQRVQGD